MPERTKRTRPCDACRRRKTKCVTNAGDSICVLCRFHNQECTYDKNPVPRKRATSSAGETGAQVSSRRISVSKTRPGTGVEEYDALPGATLLRRTLGLQNLHHSRYIGINDVLAVVYDEGDYGFAQRHHPGQVRFVHPCHAFEILPDLGTPGYTEETAMLHEIERAVQGHGAELVNLFFRIVHPSFPVLHKMVFLEKYARSFTEFSPPLLAAVYLLASGYWSFSDTLAASPMPDLTILKALAWRSFQSASRRPKLSTVQAGLLLSQHSASDSGAPLLDRPTDSTTSLVELAYGLGLHIDAAGWDIPDWEICLRRRLSWAVYVHDKWHALLHGRPSLINDEDWAVHELRLDDFPESAEDEAVGSSEVQRGRLLWINMVGLTIILSSILQYLLSVRFQHTLNCADNKLVTLLTRLKRLQISLKDWFATLPEPLKMDTVASMKLSSVGYLRLAYLTVETSIHRLIIRTISQTMVNDDTLVRVCRAAASERFNNAVDFIQRLQASHLASFWYFTSAQCCALIYHYGRLLARTATSMEERADFERKLREYTWALRVNGEAGTTFMRHALSMIDSSSRLTSFALENHGTDNRPETALGSTVSGANTASTASDTPMDYSDSPTTGLGSMSANEYMDTEVGVWNSHYTNSYNHPWGGQSTALS